MDPRPINASHRTSLHRSTAERCRGTATTNPFTLEMMVDRALEEHGVRRRVALRTPTAFGLAQAVACSDLVGSLAKTGAKSSDGRRRRPAAK